jgi:fido (protein-threonine AMPylation protein)
MARLGELDPDAESFARRSSRIFLDELLRGEFGESAWAQADFQKMIDDIQDEWVASPQLVAGLRELAQRAPRSR